jgi:hypothetical protein
MADKKTFYTLKLVSISGSKEEQKICENLFNLPHDILSENGVSEDGFVQKLRFSNDTLNRFA